MSVERRLASGAALMAMAVAMCSAQTITSARSGTVHYFEGDVSIDGTALQQKNARFTEVKEQEVLRTGLGRAEVLLTPGVFLRVGENSAVRMLDTRLVSTRVEVMSGNAIVESDDPQMSLKDSPVTLVYGDYQIRVVKHGLVEIGSDPSEMKVFKGEAEVTTSGNRAIIKEGQKMPFAAGLVAEKFETKTADDLYLWARDRSQSLSAANMASARTLNGSGFTDSGYGVGNWTGGWYFNPYMDMFTYVPAYGMLASPFGFGFFSPGMIYSYYMPQYYAYGGNAFSRPVSTGTLGSPMRVGSLSGGAPALGSPVRGGSAAPAAFGGGSSALGSGGFSRGIAMRGGHGR
jgi:hypothetical protein